MSYAVYAVVVAVSLVAYVVSHRKQIREVYGTEGLAWFAVEFGALCMVFVSLFCVVMLLGMLQLTL
jgi:uncharacterized membrane protein